MENINFEGIGIVVVTLLTYLAGQKWIWPLIIKCWTWFKDREHKQIDTLEEINQLKVTENDYYEKTFTTLLNQITSLEEELTQYGAELEKLRTQILRLNAKLYQKSLLIAKMQNKCCAREDCPHRIMCENFLTQLENPDNAI